MPWAISFHDRMLLLRQVLDAEKLRVQGSNDITLMGGQGFRSKGIQVYAVDSVLRVNVSHRLDLKPFCRLHNPLIDNF
jgi:hypothetical protein